MSLDQQLPPTGSATPTTSTTSTRHRVDAFYGRLFGWSVKWRGEHPFLALENGICAATLPKINAGPVLARLAATGCRGPALALPTPHGRRVALLAETDGLVPPRAELPRGVEILAWGALLPLPVEGRRGDAGTEWLTAPDPRERWLPSLSAVLAGVQG
jgi:hypothetical protein